MNDRSTSIARLQFLGTQRITIGADVITPESERLFAMIVRLCVPLGRLTSRQTMLDLLWPGAEDAPARHNLRQTVYKARELGLVVESDEDGLRLDPRHWSCDWEDAVGDVPGEWLCDYEPEFSDELRSWIGSQQIGVHASLRPRLIRTLQAARSSGDLLLADRHAVQLLRVDELNEEATLTRAEVMALQGAKIDALKLLDAYLHEIGRLGSGKDAALPAQLLRRRIAEKLPALTYNNGSQHYGPLIGRADEAKRLIGGLFDARAGRGTATLVHGAEGIGKSRLLLEVRRAAILQGMQMLEVSCESVPRSTPFSMLRELVRRLLEVRGACGISETAMSSIRAWLISNETAPDDCPLMEIEDLLASVSEETPTLVLMEHAERMDAESLGRLDRLYRRGVSRYHQLVLTSSTYATPSDAAVALSEIERLALRPMSLVEVRDVVTAFAAEALPRATSDQVACAAVFAEGNPMYGVEMLGLILDEGSPDVIPWRVKVAVERVAGRMTELQRRVLALSKLLGQSARPVILSDALDVVPSELTSALEELEAFGFLAYDDGSLLSSELVASAAGKNLVPITMRQDSLRAADSILDASRNALRPTDFYSCLRLLVSANEETRARKLLDSRLGGIVRVEKADDIVYELTRVRLAARSHLIRDMIGTVLDEVAGGANGKRSRPARFAAGPKPTSLPELSAELREAEYTLASAPSLHTTLLDSRDLSLSPTKRLAEGVSALVVAFNRNDAAGMKTAYQAVTAVRDASEVNPFDIHRADVIYFSFSGERERALQSAELLAEAARVVANIELACTGLRNAAEATSVFGNTGRAVCFLNEARLLACSLGYHSQVVWCDLQLADIHIHNMDLISADQHLVSASALMEQHSFCSPLVAADLQSSRCWYALATGNFAQAQKSARLACRSFGGNLTGTPLWAKLAVRLATHRGRITRTETIAFAALKESVGSRAHYGTEQLTLAAMALFAVQRGDIRDVSAFVRAQFPRLEENGRKVWPFLVAILA